MTIHAFEKLVISWTLRVTKEKESKGMCVGYVTHVLVPSKTSHGMLWSNFEVWVRPKNSMWKSNLPLPTINHGYRKCASLWTPPTTFFWGVQVVESRSRKIQELKHWDFDGSLFKPKARASILKLWNLSQVWHIW